MNSRFQSSGEQVLLTLWVGGMWFAGYVVAPVLFNMLDKQQAGNVAGQIFTVTSYIGLLCGSLLLLGQIIKPVSEKLLNIRALGLIVMLALILVGQFVLQPMMQELKQQGLLEGSQQAAAFGKLHGIASVIFLFNSIIGLVLVIIGLRPAKAS